MATQRDDDLKAAMAYIGKPFEALQAACKSAGWRVRIVKMDGRPCIGTQDFRTDRYNVSVIDGKISEIVGIG